MFEKTVTYTDFRGNERTDSFFFHLKKTSLITMEVSKEGGYQAFLERVSKTKNPKEVWEEFGNIIDAAYGELSDDGRYFTQSPEVSERFRQSKAYDELMFSLITDAKAAAEFFSGLFPDIDPSEFERKVTEELEKAETE